MTTYFLHGLDSSGQGTKGTYFSSNFPHIHCPDFTGELHDRLSQFSALSKETSQLTLIGSSFGGLMATCFAIEHPERIKQLILLAPALNFSGFTPPAQPIGVPTLLVIGNRDDVTPPDPVLPLARSTFSQLEERLVDDDHMLHTTFHKLPWQELLK